MEGLNKISLVEKCILGIVFFLLLLGIFLRYTDLAAFDFYVKEDSVVEIITVVGLLATSALCFYRVNILWRDKSRLFLLFTFFMAVFFLFIAGEEISWGQRIFGINSPEYFVKNNYQQETNLHNLVVGGKKINKLVFTLLLGIIVMLYLLVFPFVYRKWKKCNMLANYLGIPVPRFYQIISIGISGGLSEIPQHDKNAELLELAISLLFFLIVCYPQNSDTFKKE